MPPNCKIINFTPSSLTWLEEMILGENQPCLNTTGSFLWSIVTKYYKAEVVLKLFEYKDLIEESFNETEAVVFYCDTSKDTLEKAELAWMKIKESSPAVCLFVVETATDDVINEREASRTEILDWCLSNQFELVECDENITDEDGTESDLEQFDEKAGRERILQALRAHTWSNLELIEETEDINEGEDNKHGEENIPSSVTRSEEENRTEDPTFEELFSQIVKMKDTANNLPDEDRKAYAEKVALAFYKSIGLESDEDD